MGNGLGNRTQNLFSALHPDVYRHLFHLPLLSYSLFVPRYKPIKTTKPDGFPPVVLVHGLGGSRGDFLPMDCYLRLHGRRRTYRIGLDGKRSLNEMSHKLARFVQRVLKVNDSPKIDIVAHSLGGIVARLAIVDYALGPVVRTLVTLGTPHQGTVPARYMDTRLIRAIHPDSPTIQKLRWARWPKGVRGVTFWSNNDLFFCPQRLRLLEGRLE